MASLFGALTVAVGGLTAQSNAIGNVSDDLSNAQTVGFKTIGTTFQDLVTDSSSTINDPGGVTSIPQYQNDGQGNLVQSGTSTSLAITGQGFFPVETATVGTTGATTFTGNNFYTRQGDFTLNNQGFLVNSSGYYLQGWQVNPTTGVVNTSTTVPIQLSALIDNPVATSSASYQANLPANVASGFTSSPSTIQIFDALGNTHDMSLTWTNTGTDTWQLSIDVAHGVSSASDYTATANFTFSNSANTGTIAAITSGTGNYTIGTPQTVGSPADVSFTLDFPGAAAQTLTLGFGDFGSATGVTQFASSSGQVSVSSFQQNGLSQGSFNSLNINSSGEVGINFNNGTSKVVAQIPIAQFFAQDQLQRVSGGAYSSTLASGDPRLGAAGTNGGGTIVGGSLEASTVDIATEFTDMIQAQQVYAANAKTITTVDNMLNTIINTIQ
jgi:flagellar hook protein FlgE